MSENPWNEVVQAYEKHFDCLEAAREEYRKAVEEVIGRLKEQCDQTFSQNQKETDGFEIKVAQQTSGDNFGNFGKTSMTLEVRSRPTDDQDYIQWATITARMGKPWEGEDRTIQLKLEMARDNDNVLSWTWQVLKKGNYQEIRSWPTSRTEKIPLSDDDFTEQAQKGLSELVREVKDRARELIPAIEPIQKFARVMHLVNAKRPKDFGEFSQKNKGDRWYGTIYVQTDSMKLIRDSFYFWFALHLPELKLLFGFTKLPSRPSLGEEIAEELACNPRPDIGGDSAELLTKKEFHDQEDAAIAERCLNVLRIFIKKVSDANKDFSASSQISCPSP